MRVRMGVVAVLCVVLATSAAIAFTLLTLEATSSPPHVVGWGIGFQVTVDTEQPGYVWDWRCTQGGGTQDYHGSFDTGTTPAIWYQDKYIGSYDERCTATWPFPPPGTTSQIVRPFTTVGPNNDTLTQGNGVESSGFPQMVVATKWQIRYEGTAIGPYASVVSVEERLSSDGQNWAGWTGVDPGRFEYNNLTAEINDVKDINIGGPNAQALWDSFADGQPVFNQYQQNRVSIADCFGNPMLIALSTHHFIKRKVSATSWRFESLD